jgi:RNA polymerase sigma-70 factor, ECF subfamily
VAALVRAVLSQHVDRLYRAAWGLCGSRGDAEDLAQEAFTRVLSRRRTPRADDELCSLMHALRSACLARRWSAPAGPAAEVMHDDFAAGCAPAGRAGRPLDIGEVFAAIAQLPDEYRLALVAVDVLGLSRRLASRALEIRDATLTARLVSARRALAALMLAPAAPEKTGTQGS